MRDRVGQALTNKLLTKPQAQALLRHARHHSEGHMLFMIKNIIDKHLTFQEAHHRAMIAVGR